MWGRVARLFLLVVAAIAELVRRKQAKREMEEMQHEQDSISDDPSGWIIEHFGVPSDDADSADTVPDEAKDHD